MTLFASRGGAQELDATQADEATSEVVREEKPAGFYLRDKRGELVYVPERFQKQYLDRILNMYLNNDGKLLVAEYGLSSRPPNTSFLGNLLEAWGYDVINRKSGYHGGTEHTRVYVITR